MMKRLARWLSEHAVVMGDGGRESVLHLWCILVSFLALTFFCAFGLKGKELEYLCMVLYLGASVLPPIIAGIIAAVKKQPWNPWYWFPIVIGNVIGGFVSMIFCWAVGWVSFS